MSATLTARSTVTPVKHRRRRESLRGPVARPQAATAPLARPAQPAGPVVAGRPIELVLAPRTATRAHAAAQPMGPVRLTDRGLLAVMVLLAVLTVATVTVGLVAFFGVSNAPLEQQPAQQDVSIALQR
ncbi:hypothetical protein [Luteococcus peritonei]|uniref:Uncharacterized protein n=1 Tax=Luteococcus peritonei TaxID=88874 RepID=A0ABW4RRP7_9ACTN